MLTGAVRITSGGDHVCVTTGNGVVECWGDNNNSQIGDSTSQNRDTPTQVVGLTCP
jgi:alpha-tubulin suppressor-like RCC1 family protein